MSLRSRIRKLPFIGLVGAASVAVIASPATAAPVTATTASSTHWVSSWSASPSDADTPIDAAGTPLPQLLTDQTLRMVITPHTGGTTLRIHLSNRFGLTALSVGRVTVEKQTSGASTTAVNAVRFSGAASTTIAPGTDRVSDAVPLTFTAFQPLSVSIYLPGAQARPTKHWNANATSYYAPALSGDLTASTSGTRFVGSTQAWLYLDGLDVVAPKRVHTVVAFGDSITDGFVAATKLSLPADTSVSNTNSRYPDFLQRRATDVAIPVSITNAGISSNQLLVQTPGPGGPSGLSRFQTDVVGQAGVTGVIALEGINDLGIAHATSAQVISGYEALITQAHTAGLRIALGTILPASNSIGDGVITAPLSEISRQKINAWIRSQHQSDAVVDFDAALRDPSDPSIMNPAYASVDGLHPNAAGYRLMAATVDLRTLQMLAE